MPLSLVLVLITLAGCLLFAVKPVWFSFPVTLDAVAWDRQFTWTLWITGIIFVAAQILLAWVVFGARGRVPRRFEVVSTVAAAALFLSLSVAGSRGWAKVSGGSAGKEIIEVDSHQFAWNFRYPGPDGRFGRVSLSFVSDAGGNPVGIDPGDPAGKDDIVTSTLRVPAGRDVLLLLHSRDVIHDFFVRELRTKQDIVPGMEIPFEIHIERPGTYEIACAELCGLGHSQMRSVLIAMPPAEFEKWKLGH